MKTSENAEQDSIQPPLIQKFFIRYFPIILKIIGLITVLYIFLLSIQLMGASFKMFGKDFAASLMQITSNPFIGLFIGIFATSIIQSSSTTTSIIVGLVAGGAIPVSNAIPMVMGANIGTSVTNSIVSLGHIRNKTEFARAFAGAIVHDFFNLITTAILLPLELIFHPLEKISSFLTNIFINAGGFHFASPVKIIIKPVIVLLKETIHSPIILLIISAVLLFFALTYLVKLMKSLIIGKVEILIDAYLFKNIFTAFILGIVLTALLQSSSITTSLIIPMIGAGILTVKKIYPYTLGANVGTTITAIMAALITSMPAAITIAFAHLLFNILGIAVTCSIFGYLPVKLAQKFAKLAANRKKLAIFYVMTTFFIIPLLLILLTS